MATRFFLFFVVMDSSGLSFAIMADSCVDFMFMGSRIGFFDAALIPFVMCNFDGMNEAVGVNDTHRIMIEYMRFRCDAIMVAKENRRCSCLSLSIDVSWCLLRGQIFSWGHEPVE